MGDAACTLCLLLYERQAPKKDQKDVEPEDKAFKDKQKAEQAALKEAREKGTLTNITAHSPSIDL